MKIEISKEEYRALLDVLHIAEWVIQAHKSEKDPRAEPFDRIIQKFYALAGTMGLERLIRYEPGAKQYVLTKQFDDATKSWELIDEFIDDIFWDELAHRLAERDAARTIGGYEQLDRLGRQERTSLEGPVLDRYQRELDDNGLERLEIIEHFGVPHAAGQQTHD
jgi:hypothetical protein